MKKQVKFVKFVEVKLYILRDARNVQIPNVFGVSVVKEKNYVNNKVLFFTGRQFRTPNV